MECPGYDLKLEGLTFQQFTAQYKIALKQEYEELRRIAAMHGAQIPALKEDIETDEDYAKEKDSNPLFEFPYDVEYLTAKQCNDQIKYYEMLQAKNIEIDETRIWDKKRKNACIGNDLIKKRCSMNDMLWAEYKNNKFHSLEDVKHRIKLDIVKSKLYPEGWTDYTKQPPVEYVQKLKQQGVFNSIIEELQELMNHG